MRTSPVNLQDLIYRHPLHKRQYRHWQILDAISKGGSAMTEDIRRELIANPDQSQSETYNERLKLAPFDSLISGILMRLSSQILMDQASYEGLDGIEWNSFFESGALAANFDQQTIDELSFHGFLIRSLIESLITGKAIAEIDEVGAGKPVVKFRPQSALWDWQKSGKEYDFAKLHDFEMVRDRWDSPAVPTHGFTVFERTLGGITAQRFNVQPRDLERFPQFPVGDLMNSEDKDVVITGLEPVQIFSTVGGVQRFPVVALTIPSQLVVADVLYDLQKSYYNHVLGGEWALLQTNYAQLVFTGVEESHQPGNANKAKGKPAGDGKFWELEPGQDAKWLVRQPDGIQLSIDYQDKLRGRMLEMIHAIAESASTYSSRYQSGDSKKEQRRPLDILLEVFGECVRNYAKQVLDVCSIVTNSDAEWTVTGFTDYHTQGLLESIEEFLKLDEAHINSPTLKIEAQKAIAAKAIEKLGISPSVQKQVSEELATQPFNLTDAQRENLARLARDGVLSRRDLFTTLMAAGDFPANFNIEEAIARAEGQPINQLPPETILSDGTEDTTVTEPQS